MGKKVTTEDFIRRAIEKYGDKYEYGKTVYCGNKGHVIITCPKHGDFQKGAAHFLNGQECPVCSGRVRRDNDMFVADAKKVHPEYDYSKSVFKRANAKVIVTCPEHGDFAITPTHLLAGQGCPKCRYIKSAAGRRRSIEVVVAEARKVHGDKYDYSQIVDYKNDRIKYPIVCPNHGVFYMNMNAHIKAKQGCPECGRDKGAEFRTRTFDEYVSLAKLVHNNRYEYDPEGFTGTNGKIKVICKKHGFFYQSASNHLHLKQGCPVCGAHDSNGEGEIYEFVKEICGDGKVYRRDKTAIVPQELDIYIPSTKVAIEYDGLYWHSEAMRPNGYHLEKTVTCEKNGIRLLHVFEDEWLYKNEIVKSVIRNVLGKTEGHIYARQCAVKEVDTRNAMDFLEANHLQGRCAGSVYLGLYYKDELVSLMTFGKSRHFVGNGKAEWELLRFCNKTNTLVNGGASRLFKHFVSMYQPSEVITYADRRISKGNLYEQMGFELTNISRPNYYYVIGRERKYRFNFRKSVLMKKYGCPADMSEHEFCMSKRWYRIYDCGCLCYRWSAQKGKKNE